MKYVNIVGVIHKAFLFIEDFLYPKRCFSCKKLGVYFCGDCAKNLKKPQSFYVPFLDNLIIGGRYAEPALKSAIRGLKYNGIEDIAGDLSYILYLRIKNFLPSYKNSKTLLAPIPLSAAKKRRRGFNQAELLADHLSKISKLEMRPDLLEKIIDTRPQVDISLPEERMKNVRNSFRVNRAAMAAFGKPEEIRIILVDDVATTGATLSEAARVLKETGAQTVIGLAVAKG